MPNKQAVAGVIMAFMKITSDLKKKEKYQIVHLKYCVLHCALKPLNFMLYLTLCDTFGGVRRVTTPGSDIKLSPST